MSILLENKLSNLINEIKEIKKETRCKAQIR
jgi:hypothetical protein